jgi:hypothetical protein
MQPQRGIREPGPYQGRGFRILEFLKNGRMDQNPIKEPGQQVGLLNQNQLVQWGRVSATTIM